MLPKINIFMISMIAAMSRNRVIGINNQLPWRMPADIEHFRSLTSGKPVIMGRKTFESIGKALPGRMNIVVTKDRKFSAAGVIAVHSVDDAVKKANENKEIFVIGGASIYEQFLPKADRMYLTLIDGEFEGDAFFPKFNPGEWMEIQSERHAADKDNPYDYVFVTLERNIKKDEGKRKIQMASI